MTDVTSGYGSRTHPITGQKTFHSGVDFRAPAGSPIYASKPLVVDRVDYQYDSRSGTGYGHYVVARDPVTGQQYKMAHLDSRPDWKPGDTVKPGEVLAHTGNSGGSSGAHLHYEVLNGGKPVDPSNYKSSTPVSFDKDKGNLWNTQPNPNKNRRPSEQTSVDKQSKDDTAQSKPGKPNTPPASSDPIGDLIKQKEQEKQKARGKNPRDPNKQYSSKKGPQRPFPTSGSVLHNLHDGG
jgi:hypothetical protein